MTPEEIATAKYVSDGGAAVYRIVTRTAPGINPNVVESLIAGDRQRVDLRRYGWKAVSTEEAEKYLKDAQEALFQQAAYAADRIKLVRKAQESLAADAPEAPGLLEFSPGDGVKFTYDPVEEVAYVYFNTERIERVERTEPVDYTGVARTGARGGPQLNVDIRADGSVQGLEILL